MRNPIVCLLMWLLILTLPPTGRHRPRPAAHSHRRPRRPTAPAPAPARRSPYAQEQTTLLDGARSPLERPYLAAVQRRRRRTLWLATVGVDVDRRNIHAGGAR
ncbi:hypothetical protein ACFU51_06805 [Streptomyces sp. NPDC057430]|uniref:hypothetical protein n=1 Tax=unclassified Streptomyces TaxID=2593676 RepID=UPI0036B3A830